MTRTLITALIGAWLAACSGAAHHHDDTDGGGRSDLGGVEAHDLSSATIYCGLGNTTECECATEPTVGLSAGESCGPTTVPGPVRCCATTGWPTMPLNGGFDDVDCVCSQLACIQNADVCICGFKTDPTPGDMPVSSCTGTVCCRTTSTYAPECICTTENLPCDAGAEQVPSCGTADVQCDLETPAACQ